MGFKLPDIHELSVDVDGVCFRGSWYVALHDMVVNYNGHTASTRASKEGADEAAAGMLRTLVEKHCVKLEAIPSGISQPIRVAAHRYANSADGESDASDLVMSFGDSAAGSAVHRQLSWLCVNAVSMVVPAWKHMCDGDAAGETFRSLQQWLQDPAHPVDWSAATTPVVALRDGVPVADCDICRLEPIAAAVASAAQYLQSARPADATAVLLSASHAYDEGCHSGDAPDRFEKWLVLDVLGPALECRPVGEMA